MILKNKLMKITDMTMSELLSEEVIMPSVYFETFDKNAKVLEVEILEDNFEHEINKILVEEFNNISKYMNKTISNIELLGEATAKVEVAIERNDKESLKSLRIEIKQVEKDMKELKELIFIDSLTKAYNRKWIYKKILDTNGNFKDQGIFTIIEIEDFEYITSKYGSLIADNVLIFMTNFINKNLKKEGLNFKLARYCSDKFILFFEDIKMGEVKDIILNIQGEILNTTLKSKSGIMFKTGFSYKMDKFIKNDNFQELLEVTLNKLNMEKKFPI